MGFFFKNKKKNKEEKTVTPVVETTPEVPAKEGMILVREGIKLGLPTVSMEEAIVAAGELLRDLGYVDEERFIYLTGRKKNLIITKNGENVSPEELENKLSSSRLVQEVLVREAKGVIEAEIYPDEEYAKKQGLERKEEVRLELQKLIDEYNQGAPAYKKIYSLIIREKEFEKTASRKIKRY